MHKAEAGDMLGVVGSLLSAGTHLQQDMVVVHDQHLLG